MDRLPSRRLMSPLQTLAPDQRAVLELLLRQGRSYAELSELLGLPEDAVRHRAHTALPALAPDGAAATTERPTRERSPGTPALAAAAGGDVARLRSSMLGGAIHIGQLALIV